MRLLKSLNNSLDILELFLAEEGALTLGKVTERCPLTKAGAHAILANLVQREYLHYDSLRREYSLGLRTWQLGSKLIESLDIRKIALPVLTELTVTSGETALLGRYSNGSTIYLECVVGPASVSTYTRPGARAPGFCTATGKAQLAFAPEGQLRRICGSGLDRYTPYTITDPSVLRSELEVVRKVGYAVNRGEYREDVVGVGAPLFNRDAEIAGAVALSGPAYRLGREPHESLSELLLKSAEQLKQALATSSISGVSYAVLDGEEVS